MYVSLRSRSHLTSLACAGLVVFSCARVAAHDFWIEPSAFRAAAGTPLSLALRVGEHFKGDPVPRQAAMVERFVIAGPDGTVRDVMGREGADPAGVASLATPGVHVIGYRSRAKSVELDAVKFEQYLREEGLERIIDQRKQAGRSNAPGIEIFSRCAKAIVATDVAAVTSDRITSDRVTSDRVTSDRSLGLRLELIAEQLKPGKPSTFRLLYEGQPLEGALVVAIPKDAPMQKLSARSNKAGRVNLTLPNGGVWLVKAVHMVPAARETMAEWESLWASTTFELPAKGASAPGTTAMATTMRGARRSDAGARQSDPALPVGRASR